MLKIILFTFFISSHPVHVTLLSIEYSSETRSFDAFLKVYYDDFLLDYKLYSPDTEQPDLKNKPEPAKELVRNYLNNRILFILGKKKIDAEINDITLDNNELRMNLSFAVKKKSGTFRIGNSILTQIYRDQSNLLIFKCDTFEEGIKLTPENKEHVFNVN
jgi:hypothetical protein